MRLLSHVKQAPEGAPLPRQGPGQGVDVQIPGSGSRSRATIAVVSAMIASPSIRGERDRGDMRRLTSQSGSRGRSTPEAGPRSGS